MQDLKIIDKEAALARLDSDEELYNEVVEVFFEDTPIQLGKLHQAFSDGIVSEVGRLSHSLKSAAGNIGAERLSAASLRAEKSARTGSLEGVGELLKDIQQEFDALYSHLKR